MSGCTEPLQLPPFRRMIDHNNQEDAAAYYRPCLSPARLPLRGNHACLSPPDDVQKQTPPRQTRQMTHHHLVTLGRYRAAAWAASHASSNQRIGILRHRLHPPFSCQHPGQWSCNCFNQSIATVCYRQQSQQPPKSDLVLR